MSDGALPDLRGRRVCVVGASGFIGGHAAVALAEAGAEVRCTSRTRGTMAPPAAEWLIGDIGDRGHAAHVLDGCDTLVYLASTGLPAAANEDMSGEVQRHVEVPVRVAEIARAKGVRRLLFGSSGGTVYGIPVSLPIGEDAPTSPLNAYGASKVAVENYLRVLGHLHGLSALSLRIGNPYGEEQRATRGQGVVAAAMHAAYTGTPLTVWGDGSTVRDYVHVADVARAIVLACDFAGPRGAMNIASGEGRSLREMLDAVEAATGRPIARQVQPQRAVDTPASILDVSRARAELGWSPAIGLEVGLARTARWWRDTLGQSGPE